MTPGNGKQISNPFSTGGGGVNFETQVQASFAALMLARGFAPCLPCQPIQKLLVQARVPSGYQTDDLIVFTSRADGTEERKLLIQIRHSISITEANDSAREVIRAAWSDFNNPAVFTQGRDAIALVTGPLSAVDTEDCRRLLEWARHCDSAEEYFTKVETVKFSSSGKRQRLEALRALVNAAAGEPVSNDDLFDFLRHFHLLGYDLDVHSGVMHAIIHSVIGRFGRENPSDIWAQIIREVASANQNAGTITLSSFPDDLRAAFAKPTPETMPAELSRAIPPAKVLAWDSPEFAPALVVANLLGSWDESSDADMAIVAELTGADPTAWLQMIREMLQRSEAPLKHRGGVWTIKRRGELWQVLGSRVFDKHLTAIEKCATRALKERDPQFDLEPEKRFAARMYGSVPQHSSHLRRGLAETLALLGGRSDALKNCSPGAAEAVPVLAVRAIFSEADWQRWGSLNDVLPLLAEAAPSEFLDAVEEALATDPCPFDSLFAQEGGALLGANYLTGLLWALESLAWDERFLVRAVLTLGTLVERDPGGTWANRPSNSLTTILLPWHPQTVAPIGKRKVAIEILMRESPQVGWSLLLSLMPNQYSVTSGSHKPIWRRIIPKEWEDRTTQAEYREQVAIYADIAVEAAVTNPVWLAQLIEHLDHLPEQAFRRVLSHVGSDEIGAAPEESRLGIWRSLSNLVRKHRRFSDAEWALPSEVVSEVEAAAAKIAPKNPEDLYRELFCGRDWDLYEDDEDYETQETKLETRRQAVLREVLEMGGIEAVVGFARVVESPGQVGFSLGSLGETDTEGRVLPDMLVSEDERLRLFASGFVYGSFRRQGWPWVDAIDTSPWSPGQIAQCLFCLPFASDTWERAELLLGPNVAEYWKGVFVNPYQARGNLYFVIDRLLEHGRSKAAIDCLARIVRDNETIDQERAVTALLQAVSSPEPTPSMTTHHVVTVIKALQEDPGTEQDELLKVEWAYAPLLNKHNRAAPKVLERRLASDPKLFCEMIRMIFRSEEEAPTAVEPSSEQSAVAENAYRLLHEWRTPPGSVTGAKFDGDALKRWIEAVRKSTEESGHLAVALQKAGGVLIHCPSDPDGLWLHRSVAEALNRSDMEELRRGYSIAIYNSRGVHTVDPAGEPEKELARKYEQRAEEIENGGYFRFASTLRDIGETYRREAERLIARTDFERREGRE